MYIFTNVFFGQRISRKLTDQSRDVQQQVFQFDELERYGPEINGELCRRFDSSCHGLRTERKFVALVGFLFAGMLAECRQMDRQSVQKRWSQNLFRIRVSLFNRSAWAQAFSLLAGTTGEGAALPSVCSVGMGLASHCGGGHEK
jgi:hypothetical protein